MKNRQTGVKCGLKQNKIQDISKLNKKYYHLQIKYNVQYVNTKKKALGFRGYIKNHGLPLHYNII